MKRPREWTPARWLLILAPIGMLLACGLCRFEVPIAEDPHAFPVWPYGVGVYLFSASIVMFLIGILWFLIDLVRSK